LAFVAVSNLSAAKYQLLIQLKVLATALFSVLLLGRSLSALQWCSLCVLVVGVGLVHLSGTAHDDPAAAVGRRNNELVGLVAVLSACLVSGLAGVYFEKVLKGSTISLWMRNVQLALIGGVVGVVGAYAKDGTAIAAGGFFQGYDTVVALVVCLQAAGGLLVAMVIKYADNILKGFATSISVVLTCTVSYFLFGTSVTAVFGLGAALVLLAVWLYGARLPDDGVCRFLEALSFAAAAGSVERGVEWRGGERL